MARADTSFVPIVVDGGVFFGRIMRAPLCVRAPLPAPPGLLRAALQVGPCQTRRERAPEPTRAIVFQKRDRTGTQASRDALPILRREPGVIRTITQLLDD
jgi:hypothetical protein